MGLFDNIRTVADAMGAELPKKYEQMCRQATDHNLEREYNKVSCIPGVDSRYIEAIENEMSRRGLL